MRRRRGGGIFYAELQILPDRLHSMLFAAPPAFLGPWLPWPICRPGRGLLPESVDVETVGKCGQINLTIDDAGRTEFREAELIVRVRGRRTPDLLERGRVEGAQHSANGCDESVFSPLADRDKMPPGMPSGARTLLFPALGLKCVARS